MNPNTITIIECTAINECPHCGTETEFVSDHDAHILNVWLKDNYGVDLEEAATGYTETRTGFTWEHGGNYSIVDENLLGGNGDGTREREASEVFKFAYYDDNDKTEQACGYCARYA